jgi:hypothetical protein
VPHVTYRPRRNRIDDTIHVEQQADEYAEAHDMITLSLKMRFFMNSKATLSSARVGERDRAHSHVEQHPDEYVEAHDMIKLSLPYWVLESCLPSAKFDAPSS